MGKKETKWDDIPSLDGISVDWEYEPDTDKRKSKRIDGNNLQQLFLDAHRQSTTNIPVRIRAWGKETYDGSLVDISEGGARIEVEAQLRIGEKIRFGTLLNGRQVLAEAFVRNELAGGEKTNFGLEFEKLAEKDRTYICDLISGVILQKSL